MKPTDREIICGEKEGKVSITAVPMKRFIKIKDGWIIEKITQEGSPIKITRTLTPRGKEIIIKSNGGKSK